MEPLEVLDLSNDDVFDYLFNEDGDDYD